MNDHLRLPHVCDRCGCAWVGGPICWQCGVESRLSKGWALTNPSQPNPEHIGEALIL